MKHQVKTAEKENNSDIKHCKAVSVSFNILSNVETQRNYQRNPKFYNQAKYFILTSMRDNDPFKPSFLLLSISPDQAPLCTRSFVPPDSIAITIFLQRTHLQ